jgi:ABC-type branched-subunit amino acid transport system substrate-binding protein
LLAHRWENTMPARGIRLVSAAAVLGLALTACGGSEPAAGPPAGAPGVTKEPCPKAIDKDKGCIYLGIISDLSTGPFHTHGVPMTRAQQAFWRRVNEDGGIGGYEIDAVTHVADNKYDPATQERVFQGMQNRVLALAQTLGSATTARILPTLRSERIVAVPGSWISAWEFEDVILESGASYCFASMNAIDYAVAAWRAKSVLVVHYTGDYGADAVAGAKVAAARHKLAFSSTEITPGAAGPAVTAIGKTKPDLVLLAVGPAEVGSIVGQATKAGYRGRFAGQHPTWDKALLKSPAAGALKKQFVQVGAWKPFATDSPGHTAMRRSLGSVEPDDNHTSGWVWSYPLKAVLQKAAANGDLTRDGVLKAVRQVTQIDYEGMLPAAAGDFSGDAHTAAYRGTVVNTPDDSELTGVRVSRDFTVGSTAATHELTGPCGR